MLSFIQYLNEEAPKFNNCAIVSVAALTGLDKEEVWERSGKKYWNSRIGVRGAFIERMLKELGMSLQRKFNMHLQNVEPGEKIKYKTWKQLQKDLDKNKKYLIEFSGHVVAVVNGKIVDTACIGNKKKVHGVIEVS